MDLSPENFIKRREINDCYRLFIFMGEAILNKRSEGKNLVAAISTRSNQLTRLRTPSRMGGSLLCTCTSLAAYGTR